MIRGIMERIYRIKFVNNSLKPLFHAINQALFGTDKITLDSPHIADNLDIKRFMSFVIIGLLPTTMASIYFYGVKAILIIAVSYGTGALVEIIFAAARKKEIHEGFFVTGLIFPLTLSPNTPLWIVALGVSFGVLFGKEIFGGTGRNIFNPALVGRLFITMAFPGIMSASYQVPFVDAITTATPLLMFKNTLTLTPYLDLLLGSTAGCMGEIFRLGLIIGGIFLILTKISNWRIPVFYLGTVFILSFFGNLLIPEQVAPPLFQILTGGLLLGAFFMASDPVTSPYTKIGKIIYGILCGLLTVLIRSFSGYLEGVMFSIVIMNGFSPLLDNIIVNLKFRAVKL